MSTEQQTPDPTAVATSALQTAIAAAGVNLVPGGAEQLAIILAPKVATVETSTGPMAVADGYRGVGDYVRDRLAGDLRHFVAQAGAELTPAEKLAAFSQANPNASMSARFIAAAQAGAIGTGPGGLGRPTTTNPGNPATDLSQSFGLGRKR
jgi:hypothetical protein